MKMESWRGKFVECQDIKIVVPEVSPRLQYCCEHSLDPLSWHSHI